MYEDQEVLPIAHEIREVNGRKEWILSDADLDCISLGAALLGCGGGASPYLTTIVAKEIKK